METVGADFSHTGSILTRSQLVSVRQKRGECLTCGRQCYQKTFLKMVPLTTADGMVLEGRCLLCRPVLDQHHPQQHRHHSLPPPQQQRQRQSYPPLNLHPPLYDDDGIQDFVVSADSVRTKTINSSRTMPPPNAPAVGGGGGGGRPVLMPRAIKSFRHSVYPRSGGTITTLRGLNELERESDSSNSSRKMGGFFSRAASVMPLKMMERYRESSSSQQEVVMPQEQCHQYQPREVGVEEQQSRSSTRSPKGGVTPLDSTPVPSMTFMDYNNGSNHARNVVLTQEAENGSNPAGSTGNTGTLGLPPTITTTSMGRLTVHRALSHSDRTATGASSITSTSSHGGGTGGGTKTSTTTSRRSLRSYDSGVGFPRRGNSERSVKTSTTAFLQQHVFQPQMMQQQEQDWESSVVVSVPEELDIVIDHRPGSLFKLAPSTFTSATTLDVSGIESRDGEDLTLRSSNATNIIPRHHLDTSLTTTQGPSKVVPMEDCDWDVVDNTPPKGSMISTSPLAITEEGNQASYDTVEALFQLCKGATSASSNEEIVNSLNRLAQTTTLSETEQQVLGELGIAKTMMEVIKGSPDSLEVQLTACAAVRNVTGIKQNQIAFMELGVIEMIVTATEEFPDSMEMQEAALEVIANLAKAHETLSTCDDLGIVQMIVNRMNQYSDVASVQIAGCNAVASMASHRVVPPHHKERMMTLGTGGCVVIAMLMHSDDPYLQERALRALRNLSSHSDDNKQEFINIGGVDSIIRAMQIHRDQLNVQLEGACALVNLAHNDATRLVIGDSGGIVVVVRAMWVHTESIPLQEWCSKLLFNLSLDQRNCDLIVEVGGISAIVTTMQARMDTAIVQEMACAILTNLVNDDEEMVVRRRIVDEDALDAIVLAMAVHTDKVNVQEWACTVLMRLVAIPSLRTSLRDANVHEVLLLAARNFPLQCDEMAQHILQTLSRQDT